jgi:hypothetical protein
MMVPVIARPGKLNASADQRIFTPRPPNDPMWKGPIHFIT